MNEEEQDDLDYHSVPLEHAFTILVTYQLCGDLPPLVYQEPAE